MAWTDERVEKLKKLWEEGRSASEIAKELGNVTRNAVIGKVHRMGLQSRTTSSKTEGKTKAKLAEKATKPEAKPKVKSKVSAEPSTTEKTKTKVTAKRPAEKVKVKAKEAETEVEVGEDIEAKTKSGENQFPAMVPVSNDEISEETRRNVERIEAESKRLNLMQLTERTCKWPVGDPATDDFWFCGHPSEPGKPYCQAHVELAFQAPMARRR